MYKKIIAIFVTASALAFFLLASGLSLAATRGEGLNADVMLAQQTPQSQPQPTKPQAAPSPPVHPQAKPPAVQPAQPQTQQPKPQPGIFPPAAPQPKPGPSKPQPTPPPAVQPQAQPRPQIFPPASPPAPERGAVSFNFDDADVYSVIQTIFGDVLRVNYVIDPAVKGRVTFRSVEPVAKKDVLPLMEVILRLNSIGIVEEGGLYRIIPIADISKEPAPVGIGRDPNMVKITGKALVQVVRIKYIQSSEMVRVLTPFLSKNAVIVDVPNSNYIVIVDTDANVKRLLQLVSIFDSEELEAVTPRVYVYPIQNGKAKDVANLLQQIFLGAKPTPSKSPVTTPARRNLPGQKPVPNQPQVFTSEGGSASLVSDVTKIIPDEVTNSLIIMATPDDYGVIKDAIAKIDIAPRQVIIEALIVSVKLTDNLSFGLSWALNTDVKISGLKPFVNPINLNGNASNNQGGLIGSDPGNSQGANASGFTFVGTDPTGNVRAILTALEDRSNANVVAAPHILVSDNQEARIQIGSQVPLATSTTSTPISSGTEITNTSTSTIQYKDIGIILKVKPQVNDSGLINLDFSQEISSIGQTVQVGGLNEVSIDKTEAQSNLVAQDGETIVIGGLIRQDKTKGRTGIPFLSRIPILGYLFGNSSHDDTRTELIILLTPHVVRNQQEAQSVTSQYINRYKSNTNDHDIDKFIHGPQQIHEEQKEPAEKSDGQSPAISPGVSQ